jgi:predicted XRE-type DNA-binding protein
MKNNDLIQRNKLALMRTISQEISKRKLKQHEVAEILDIKQPRVSDLINEKHQKFSLDILVGYMATLGTQIEFNYEEGSKRGIKTKVTKSASA